MVSIVRAARALVILLLAFMAISFIVAIGAPSSGVLEKAVLLALAAGCVFGAAKVTSVSDWAVHRLERR